MDNSKLGPRLRVGVCGAGIGGLILAVALSKYSDIEVVVYEAASKLAEVGAGVGLFSRPWEVIRELNLEDELTKVTEIKRQEGPVPMFSFRKSDCPEGIEFYTLVTQGNIMFFHRPDFQQVLINRVSSICKIHCGKRLRNYVQPPSEAVNLLFEDGSTATCDILVGADGLKSAVRKTLMSEKAHLAQLEGRRAEAANYLASIEPVWSGHIAYRTLVSAEVLEARHPSHRTLTRPTMYVGKDACVTAYPVSKGKLVNLAAFSMRHDQENTKFDGQWVTAVGGEEVVKHFTEWEPELRVLVECIDKPLRWAIHTVRPLSTFVHGRIALMGDAAHAMTPYQGSGAGQAIEDAFILAGLLGDPKTDGSAASIERALKIYDLVRRPRALAVQEGSRLNGRYFSLAHPSVDLSALKGRELHVELGKLVETAKQDWESAWLTSPTDSYQEAITLLHSF